MKTVKTYSNLAEAGFAHSLLEASGIPAFLADEQSFQYGYSTAAVGIRVQVEEEHYDRAVRVLAEGPDAVATPTVSVETAPPKSGLLPWGVFIAIAGCAGVIAIVMLLKNDAERNARSRSDLSQYDEDRNRDGQPDSFATYRGRSLLHSETDLNFDGKLDLWEFSGPDGLIERREADHNFDGRIDDWITYRDGLPATSRHDTDHDGTPDQFALYQNGQISETKIRPGDGPIVIRQWNYTHGIAREELTDENADGTFDHKVLIDPFGARSEKIPLPQAK